MTAKKILLDALTINRPSVVEEEISGITILSEPSFAILLAMVYGYVYPPSTDKKMSTLVALMGLFVVLAVSQVIVLVSPTFQFSAVFCDVTLKGLKLSSIVTVISSEAVFAPKRALSLTVKTKSKVLLTEGVTSQVGVRFPDKTSLNWGIYLMGSLMGSLDLYIGPKTLVDEG